ncbi:sodium-dependent transporter [Endozoicomonadaceae bacterium StTr2]
MSSSSNLISNKAFILAVTGAAVGLGNIWRFPYMAGENGGSAFLLLYIVFVLLMGLPVMMSEILVGRAGRAAPVKSFQALAEKAGHSRRWGIVALGGTLAAFMVLSFYSVVAGWCLHYFGLSLVDSFSGQGSTEVANMFSDLQDSIPLVLGFHGVFIFLTMLVSLRGARGIQQLSNVLMPLLYVLLGILVIYAAGMSGFSQAVDYLFKPDFSKISTDILIEAMGHAFFTLAIGACCLTAYGAYMPAGQSIARVILLVAVLDVLVALMSGISIFSIVFTQHIPTSSGPGLMFITLPYALADLPLGGVAVALFFGVMVIATWTSSINLAEPVLMLAETRFGCSRKGAVTLVGVLVWLAGLIPAFSFNIWKDVKMPGGMDLFSFYTAIPTNFLLPVVSLFVVLFVGWIMRKATVQREMALPPVLHMLWMGLIRLVAPVLVIIVFAAGLS